MNQVSESSGRWAGPRRGLLGTVATAAMVAGSLAVAQPAWADPITSLAATSTPLPAGRGLTVAWTPTPSPPDLVLSYLAEADGPDADTVADGSCFVDTATADTCDITGLLAGVPYTVTVTARSATGGGGTVVGAAAGTRVIAPGASTTPKLPKPDQPTAAATGVSGEIEVTADANVPADGPDIASFTATALLGGASTGKSCTTPNGATRTCKIGGLVNGTQYTFRVVANATGSNGNSVASDPSALPTVPAATPAAPTDVTAAAVDATSAEVSWTASPTEDATYLVTAYYAASGVADTNATGCAVTPTTDTTCTVTGLTANVGYYFQVVATANTFSSPASAKSQTVFPTTPPDAPAAAAAVAGDASATVTWTAPGSLVVPVASYRVTALVDGDATEHTCTSDEGLSCVVSGLDNDTAYTFAVRSVGLSGALSTPTVTAPVTPAATPKPVAPAGVTLEATDTTIEVTWDEPAADPDVPVVHFVATATPGDKSCATASNEVYTCTITGLTPETEYTVTVVARGATSTSAASEAATVTTMPAETPGGPGSDEPAGPIVVNPEGRQQIFTRGVGYQALWTATKNPTTGEWENWESLGGPLYSDPVPVRNANGKLQVFVLDVNGYVTYKLQGDDNEFGEWKRISTDRPIAKIVAAKNANGAVQIFGRSGVNLYTSVQTTGADAWSTWLDLGWPVSGDPTVVSMDDGRLEVFTAGHLGAVYRKEQTAVNTNSWGSWERVDTPASAAQFV